MKLSKILMGTTATINIVSSTVSEADIAKVFALLIEIENRFSVFKATSEISRINRGEINHEDYSAPMQEVFALAAKTKMETNGYFDIVTENGKFNPSGLVKGWAISKAAALIKLMGFDNFCVEVGGDIEVGGHNETNNLWRVGIRNPFNLEQNVKVLELANCGIATSGIYLRGQHIYDPHEYAKKFGEIVSLTVVAKSAYEADRFATAAFAIGRAGIEFIEDRGGLEAYMIDKNGLATFTSGFDKYLIT